MNNNIINDQQYRDVYIKMPSQEQKALIKQHKIMRINLNEKL